MREPAIRAALREGAPVLGAWLQLNDAFSAELLASVGFDWLLVDMEHGPIPFEAAASIVTAVRTTHCTPFVRPAWNEASHIQRALDLGCSGIIVPVVNSAEDARRVVVDARFPPLGERSRGGLRPTLAFGTDAMTYFERANASLIVLVQIETQKAIDNVDEIVAVDGVDGIFLGPNDLAASHAKRWPDVWEKDAAYMDAVARAAASARGAGKIAGFLARDAAMVKRSAELGYNFIGVSSDVNYLAGAARTALTASREALGR